MKKLKQNLFIILLSLSFAAVALPPDMQADRYLLQAEKALKGKDKDYKKAVESMDKIMVLKDKHNLELPIEFYFKYANILLESRTKADEALAAINHYLTAIGKSGANYVEALDLYGKATFWQLVQAKNKSKVEQLIKLGANINAKDKYGASPLHYAAQYNNNPDVIRALIQAGADVNARNNHKEVPLLYATLTNNNLDVIIALIQAGADVNAKSITMSQDTPLTSAMPYGNTDVIKALIQAGADIEDESGTGTALHHAALNNKTGIVIFLIRLGADVNARNYKEYTPLYYAAQYNRNADVIRALIKSGADIKDTRTALSKRLNSWGWKSPLRLLKENSSMNENEKAKVRRLFKKLSLLR